MSIFTAKNDLKFKTFALKGLVICFPSRNISPLFCVFISIGVAIAERLAPFKVKKFIYTDVAPRPDLAKAINAEYGETWITSDTL